MCKSMLTLEEEAGLSLFKYGKETSFLRQLILEGQWEDTENFLELSQLRDKVDFNQILFQIGKQKYLELLDNQQQLDQNYVVAALKSLEALCTTKEQYNGLCYLLTLKTLTDHPDYQNWTLQRGRVDCFEAIKLLLQPLFGQTEKRRTPANRLLKLLKDSINYQYHIAKQTGSMTTLKFDPVSQCSEASLLKDLIGLEAATKFSKQNLNEVKIAFYNRKPQSQQHQPPRFGNFSMEMDKEVGNDIAEEIEHMEDDEDEDTDDYYDKEFAQSMPAQYLAKQQQQQQQQYNQLMTQSINQNIFHPRQISSNQQQQQQRQNYLSEEHQKYLLQGKTAQLNPNFTKKPALQQQQQQQQEYQQLSAMQQQLTNDKQYKSIQYHKQRQSYDKQIPQQQEDYPNTSQQLNVSKLQTGNRSGKQGGLQQQTQFSTNFEFQRPTAAAQFNLHQETAKQSIQHSDYSQSQKQQQQQYSYHQRVNSKGQQSANLANVSMNQQASSHIEMIGSSLNPKRPVNQSQMVKKTYETSGMIEQQPQQQQQTKNIRKQNNNFIFQGDSEQDEPQLQIEELKQSYKIGSNKNQQKPSFQYPQTQQLNQNQQLHHQMMVDDEDGRYDDDFLEQQEDEEDDQKSQQQSVRQIISQGTHDKQQQQQQQYLETDENHPQQLISDIDPSIENNIYNLAQKAILVDSQPIRACCFSPSGNHIALGTNSKTLKICALPNLNFDDEDEEEELREVSEQEYNGDSKSQKLQVIFENENHHQGSLYCLDWSRTGKLLASGSNDRVIKILVCPDLDNHADQDQLLVLSLVGHTAIVRTVCFNPIDDLVLLSGGLNDMDLKVWNSESGKNYANLKGHSGSIYSVKMSSDGSYAMSVGTDHCIRIWDVRAKASVGAIDGTAYSDMNELVFSPSLSMESSSSKDLHSQLSGLACVGHTDGSLTFWDMNMRKCLAQQIAHKSEARGVSFTVDGKYLASAGFDNQIVVTDTSDLDNLTTVKTLQHEDKVVSVKWHPYLPMLLSTSADKTARVWYPQMSQ